MSKKAFITCRKESENTTQMIRRIMRDILMSAIRDLDEMNFGDDVVSVTLRTQINPFEVAQYEYNITKNATFIEPDNKGDEE